ncbi:hypothetical protein [Paenibacillus sp. A14]|uniref:hypothetical protein n=1 Tax=Paenibacillus sp. A14 TaxID=3119820 RepID=UPI002FE021D8
MASKKPLPKTAHFHIPTDPLRVKSEELRARHSERKELKAAEATNELLYEMLSDLLERQELLEDKLDQLLRAMPRR